MRQVTIIGAPQPSNDFEKWVLDTFTDMANASGQNVISDVSPSGASLVTLSDAGAYQFPYYNATSNAALGQMSAFTLTVLSATSAAAWLTALGMTSGGTYLVPGNNLSELTATASTARSNISAQVAGSYCVTTNNLNDVTAATARTNLGVAYGLQTIWVPAGAMKARTTAGPTGPTDTETSTNKIQINGLDFDPTTNQYAQFAVYMPKSWDAGTVTAVFVWEHPATTTNFAVVWGVQGTCIGDNEALDTAFGSAVEVTDTGGTTANQYISPETSAVTIGSSPAAQQIVWFQVYRNAASGSDTLAVAARLLGVRVLYSTAANNDT